MVNDNSLYLIFFVLITTTFISCSNSQHNDIEIGKVSIGIKNIAYAFKERFNDENIGEKKFDQWLEVYFDNLYFADAAIKSQINLSKTFKDVYKWRFIRDIGRRNGYFNYLYNKKKIGSNLMIDSNNDNTLLIKELDKQIDDFGKDRVLSFFRNPARDSTHLDGFQYFISGENYFLTNNDVVEYDKNINFFFSSTDTLQIFKNIVYHHFKYNFFVKDTVEDDYVSTLVRNSYYDCLSNLYQENLYQEYLKSNIKTQERYLLRFYNENINKFEYYIKLKLRIIHFKSPSDFFRFKDDKSKSIFTEKYVLLKIDDNSYHKYGIPDKIYKGLFYAQGDEFSFRVKNTYYLISVIEKFDYNKLTFSQARKIIPEYAIKNDIIEKKLRQLKRYKVETDISTDSLFRVCINAIGTTDDNNRQN